MRTVPNLSQANKQSEEFIFNKITQHDEELYIFMCTHFTAAYSLWLQAYTYRIPMIFRAIFMCIMYIVID